MRFFFLSLLTLFSTLVQPARADELNAGFVRGIWYSEQEIFVGDTVRMYVALRNNTESDLAGTIRFTDNSTRIGNAYVSALPGRIVEGWIDWTPVYGEHTITATLTDVRAFEIGEDPTRATVESTIAEDIVMIDYDTDHDGIGNAHDTDDDNDGIIDIDETTRGTDPLKKDTSETKKNEERTPDTRENGAERVNSVESTERDIPDENTKVSERGLEKFIGEGTIDSFLTQVTENIGTTKHSLDTYRSSRTHELDTYMNNGIEGSTTPLSIASDIASGTAGDLATITRSRIEPEKEGFIVAVIDGGKALMHGFYMLILWLISNALGHPATLELILLVGILYFVYRTARRFGRRPKY